MDDYLYHIFKKLKSTDITIYKSRLAANQMYEVT